MQNDIGLCKNWRLSGPKVAQMAKAVSRSVCKLLRVRLHSWVAANNSSLDYSKCASFALALI
jgi:hypothetical protein